MNQNAPALDTRERSEETLRDAAVAPSDFQQYLRPELGRMLHSLRLDKTYEAARADYLEYTDEAGERQRCYSATTIPS